jgi:hypothetical protein
LIPRFSEVKMASDVYFAAKSKSEIGKALVEKLSIRKASANPLLRERVTLYENAYYHYYGIENGQGISYGVTRAGERGERAAVRIGRARAFARALHSIVVAPKISWRPMARNGSAGAAESTRLAINILEDVWKRKKLNQFTFRWVEQVIAFSEAHLFVKWDRSIGPPLAPSKGMLVRQGDFAFHNILPWHCWVDEGANSPEAVKWRIVVLFENRYDLAKLCPTTTTGEPSEPLIQSLRTNEEMVAIDTTGGLKDTNSDLVPVYYFFHDATPSLPVGREVVMVSSECVLADSRLTYVENPVKRMAASEMFGTPHGWSQFWDTLGIQELNDSLETTVATNMTAFGTANIALQKGTEENPDKLVKGVRPWWYPPGANPPKFIEPVRSPPEIFPHMKDLKGDQMQILGLNDVSLGQPQSAQMNAQAFAVLASMAVQMASPFQQTYLDGVSGAGMTVLQESTKRVVRPRSLSIQQKGSASVYRTQNYTGEDLSPIEDCLVEIGNPLEQTPAGRVTILQMYKEFGILQTPENIQEVLDTGRMEPVTKSLQKELALIAYENEQLAKGVNPPVHPYQNHLLHAKENMCGISDPNILLDEQLVVVHEEHFALHYGAFFAWDGDPKMDPQYPVRVRLLLGQQPPPMMMPQGPPGEPPPGDQGTPPSESAPPDGDPAAILQDPEKLNGMPNMPKNPMTGQQFNGVDGGGIVPPQ